MQKQMQQGFCYLFDDAIELSCWACFPLAFMGGGPCVYELIIKNKCDFLLGISKDTIEKYRNFKTLTEVVQDGNNFTWINTYPGGQVVTNKFTIGKECEMETMGGKKFKATVQMEGNKIVATFPNYQQTSEIVGGKLVEISTSGGVTYERVSKKLS
ncbi:gastrotropin [Gracilinanus agilis]|uniref:gastrotropin n=1 Tax=Gracilinanus agilis TaxID=191870 RepID=UPI001CFE000B|nr:gastrotropin [Gracilinanus agilis]